MSRLRPLFEPASIAVVGASSDLSRTTGRPLAYLAKHGYAGAVYPVNPRAQEIGGLPCYPDIASLPATPEAALVLLRPDLAITAVRDLAAMGTKAAVVLAGGFQEAGEEGARRQDELRAAAGDMALLGPNTIGLVNVTQRITLSASAALEIADLQSGAIALVSQSGGILGSLLSRAVARGIGFSKLVSTGNEADVDISDCIEYLLDDPATRVIAVYAEGLRNPVRFRQVCEAAARAGKPLVVFKVGRSEAGIRSAQSHTGALAGEDRIYDALFRQLGIIRAETFSDLLDLSAALATGRRMGGRIVAILTSTGGAGTLVADSCGVAGFLTTPPDIETAHKLGALMAGGQGALDANPIDLTLEGTQPEILQSAIATLLQSSLYDGLVVVAGSTSLQKPDLIPDAVSRCLPLSSKPILVYVSPHAPELVQRLNRMGVPAFLDPESCARAFSALHRRLVIGEDVRPVPGGIDRAAVAAQYAQRRGPLDEHDSKRMFAQFGVPSVVETAFRTPAEGAAAVRAAGARAVVKARSSRLLHKSDHGGVRLNVAAEDAESVCRAMAARIEDETGIQIDGFLAQEMVADGLELILGFYKDPQLGPLLLLGAGGVVSEVVSDTSLRLLPISRDDAAQMISELRIAPLFAGYRGNEPRDVRALEDAILQFAEMAMVLGDRLQEAEINPLFVLPQGRGVKAGDGLAIFEGGEA